MNLPRPILLLALLAAASAQAAEVSRFQPQGQVGNVAQASAQFSEAMVALGQADAPPPFTIDCAGMSGEGRWQGPQTWTWQLQRPLQAGERCRFTLKPGLSTLAGKPLTGKQSFVFQGAAPRVWNIVPDAGSSIEEDQAFVIDGGGPLDAASLDGRLWCEADGVGQRIPARPVTAAIRQEVLKQTSRAEHAIVVACAETLPTGRKMKLVWGKGIKAANGTPADKEQSFVYTVREPFTASLSCEREKAGAPCSPLSAIRLNFSAPVDVKFFDKIRLTSADGPRRPQPLDRENPQAVFDSIAFPGPLPQNAELKLELPAGVKDEAGRPLANADKFPLTVRSGALPPLAKFPGDFGIVELKEGGLLPVTLRNVEASLKTAGLALPGSHRFSDQRLTEDADVIAAMRALAKFEQQSNKYKVVVDGKPEERYDPYYARELSFLAKRPGVTRQELPKPGGSAEFEVIGIPLTKPGYHIVEIESRLLGNALLATPKPMYVRSAALVTNLAVHLKVGQDNALVWVTALDTGKPVADAEVRVSTCAGKQLWQGKTDALGRAKIDQALDNPYCDGDRFLFASARSGGDFSFVRSDWNEGIEPWRFGVYSWGDNSPLRIHGILDRSLFRPGQTLSVKHLARSRDSRGFSLPAADKLPNKLVLRHNESGTEFTQPLSWDAQASAVNAWKVPESAKLGTWQIVLQGGADGEIYSSEFRVADFRLPVFTGSVQGVPARQIAVSKVPLALGLSFLNGGAAKNAEVEVSATLRPRWVHHARYADYRFNVGFEEKALAAFALDAGIDEESLVLDKQQLKLDAAGAARLEVPLPAKPGGPAELYAEMSFADPNGEIQTIRGVVDLRPAALEIGVKIADWAGSSSSNRLQAVVLDTAGKPVAGQAVKVTAKRRIDSSHRRRIVGGFYAYENTEDYRDLGEVCAGQTDSRGLLLCELSIADPGAIYLLAETRDVKGNVARAGTSYWVSGGGDLWFAAGNQDRIDVIPEKKAWAAGETARFQVRTPFREATALISVEAGGILESFVQPLSRFKPTVELPVRGEWGPNAFVSVLVVRGRVEPLKWYSLFQWGWREPLAWFRAWWNPDQPTAMVDLAKPSYRIGLAEIAVGTEAFQLKVEVSSDKADYQPREQATVNIRVSTPDGKPLPAGSEVAFAAVDQALLELRPNDSWQLLEAMLPTRGYAVETATAQGMVIGKRHFGKKALPPGGGGGKAPARELFDTLLLWQPKVTLDASGRATLRVPLNDALSEFKLVAVASAGSALFGTGSTSIRSRQDLQIISGLPPLVREGDRYTATLTLRNGTARPMNLTVDGKNGGKTLAAQKLSLAPESAGELRWPMQAGAGITAETWEFSAREDGGKAADTLRITQQVAPAVPVTVQHASFQRVDGDIRLPVTPPTGALPGKGGVEVALSPKLATPPPGLLRFFADYPYACLEQKTSVAVGLHDPTRWQQIADTLPGYLDENGLAAYFPGLAGSPTLTAYLLDVVTLAGFPLPEESRRRMLQGLNAFVDGRLKRDEWAPGFAGDVRLHRRLNAMQALVRQGEKPQRAAAALDIDPLLLPTAALIDWTLVLKALPDLPQREAKYAAARQELRNRLGYAGNRLVFANERADYGWWMMASADANAFRLIEAMLDDADWQADLPRLLQGALERQQRGRWLTTTANAWARVTLDRFAQKFEREAVTGITKATLAPASAEFDWKSADSKPLTLPWPAKPGKDDALALSHAGSGKPWANVQVLAAIPDGPPRQAGYRIQRQLTPLQQKTPGKFSRGDLWRVTLSIDAEHDMSWVAISDPVPAGARILGDGDGRDSAIATRGESEAREGRWPSFIERSFGAWRAYYEMLPRGRTQIAYTVRLNNAGDFALPPTRVEAMYAPDVFGELPNARLQVGE